MAFFVMLRLYCVRGRKEASRPADSGAVEIYRDINRTYDAASAHSPQSSDSGKMVTQGTEVVPALPPLRFQC